jgi:hypothetical protein
MKIKFAPGKKEREHKMNKLIKTTLVLLVLGIPAMASQAQDDGNPPPDGPGPRGHHPPPSPIVRVLDANHDHIIDSNEIANASAALLTLDTNGDGVLTTNEYMPAIPADAPADAPRPPVPLIVKALDVNGDGVIDATEIANAPAELKTLDKNGDGQLTPDEFMGPRPPRRAERDNDSGPGDQGGPPQGPPPGQ